MVPDARIAAIAARQHGVVTLGHLREAGLTRGEIESRIRLRRLHRLHRGVYAVGHRGVGPLGRELAAVLASGKGALLADESAGARYGFLRQWRGDVRVVRPHSGKLRGVRIRKAVVPPRDRSRHFGIPITSPGRTLQDLARVLRPEALERAMAEAQVRRLVSAGELAERGLTPPPPTRSGLERAFVAMVEREGLPPPVVNGIVEGFEVDAHWPAAKVVVELDSYEFHAHRQAFEQDRQRDAILQAAGWRTVRLTHRGMRAGTLRRLLARAPP